VLSPLVDFTSRSGFSSDDEPGQWVCWDFREMRVRPTHYALSALFLKSWVVEGSMDGVSWWEIDRQTDNQVFAMNPTDEFNGDDPSFAVSNPAECRCIRLTQTDKGHDGDDFLTLGAVEFFGTLAE
jgi:hypothetical protein